MSLKKTNNKGIGLVETILALGIAVVVITALVSLAVYTLRSSQQSKYLLEGSKLAAEQVEILRIAKDSATSWSDFSADAALCVAPNAKCIATPAGITLTTDDTQTEVTLSNSAKVDRYFFATIPDTNVVRVTSIVEWKVGPSVKKTTVITDITNWRGQ